MKKILLLIFLIAPLIFYGQTTIHPGAVSGQWDLAGSPYMVVGDIYIEKTADLVIDAGVEVIFYGWYKLEVIGSLTAIGNSSSMILFTAAHVEDKWHGIRFVETSASSYLDHCIIEYAVSELEAHLYPDILGGGLLCYNSPNANIEVSNSIIRKNMARIGGGVMCYHSKVKLENCDIRDNEALQGGGIALYNNSIAVLRENTIRHNNSSQGGGLLINNNNSGTIECNYIVNNTSEYGGGVYYTHSSMGFCKNTIARNTSSEEGGGFYFQFNSIPEINSCLVYFNEDGSKTGGEQVYLAYNCCDPAFNHCNIMGGSEGFTGLGSAANYSGNYENCVDDDPLFKDMLNYDYTITWANYPYDDNTKSICIDNGCPAMGQDPDKSCCDIGACYYSQILDVPENIYGEAIRPQIIEAEWDRSFGALGYKIDLAYDRYFTDMIYENLGVGTNSIKISIPELADMVWLRIRSFNTGITSDNSNSYALLWVSLGEDQAETPKIFASTGAIHIITPQTETCKGEAWIYNTSGQLLGQYSLVSGTNTISTGYTKQIVIVKVVMNNQVYQQKLLLH